MGCNATCKRLLDKSVQASIAAIEIYNKPIFKYREETFSILMVNAWELLLKAKIVKEKKNKLISLYIEKKKKDGQSYKTLQYETNKDGERITIGINEAIKHTNLDTILREQLSLLIKIKNNSMHFYNQDNFLKQKVLSVALATLQSYILLLNKWFSYDILSKHDFFIIPIAFKPLEDIKSTPATGTKRSNTLSKCIAEAEQRHLYNKNDEHHISLEIPTHFTRSSTEGLAIRKAKKDEEGILFIVQDEYERTHTMTYKEVVVKVKEKCEGFKRNKTFHKIMRKLKKNPKLCKKRFLDRNEKGTYKEYYNQNIVQEILKEYKKLPKIAKQTVESNSR